MKSKILHFAPQQVYKVICTKLLMACLLLMAILLQTVASAQTNVKGKVVNEDGQPLAGASINVKGAKVGTSTDEAGNFALDVPAGSRNLIFSFAGYQSKELPASSSAINVVLSLDVSDLNDVVVVGYGTQKKRDMTGASSTIRGSSIAQVPVPSFDAALQGRASGVQVSQQSGAPGGAVRIQVRGTSSLSSGTEPLYVIDGIPVFQDIGGIGDGRTSNVLNPMSNINPNDIESIEILKDAAATAIYGSRGANGVVLVTTKTGKRGQGKTTVDYNRGVSNATNLMNYASGSQWLQMVDEARTNSVGYGITPGQERFDPQVLVSNNLPIPGYVAPDARYGPLTSWTRAVAEQTNTNWVDQMLQQGNMEEINLTTSNGFEKGSFFISGQMRDEEGIIQRHRLQRYAVRSNVDFYPTDRLKAGARLSFSLLDFNQPQIGAGNNGGGLGRQNFGATGGWGQANTGSLPIMPIFNPNGSYFDPLRGRNVVSGNDPANFNSRQLQNRFVGNAYLEYKLLPELSIRTEAGADYINSNSIYWASDIIRYNRVGQETGRFLQNYLANVYANYNKKFGENHDLSATVGYELQKTSQRRQDYAFEGLVGSQQEIGEIANGTNQFITAVSGIFPDRNFTSVFGRVNYKFKDRYLLGGSFRRDGSTAFGPNNRFGNFPAVSAGWLISNETFANKSNFLGKFNLLKLRASYGQTGNANIPSFAFQSNYVNWPVYGNSPALGFSVLANPNIAWEKNNQVDMALEFALFGSRLRGSFGYFNRKSNDMLLNVPVAPTVGIGPGGQSVLTNIGDLRNQGLEIELGGTIVASKKGRNGFSWNADLNMSFINNGIVNLTDQFKLMPTGNFPVANGILSGVGINQIGGRLGTFYLAEYAGIDNQGFETIFEIDKDILRQTGKTVKTGNVIPATQTNINNNRIVHDDKTGLPTWFGGLTNSMSYKGFELNVLLTFQGGNYIYDGIEENTSYVRTGNNVIRADVFNNTWNANKQDAIYPRLTWNMRDNTNNPLTGAPAPQTMGTRTTRYLYRGDFARLKTIQFAYNLPQAAVSKLRLQGVRIYANVQNLFTITNYPGFDPESVILGGNQDRNLNQGFIGSTPIPQVRTFNGGLSVTF